MNVRLSRPRARRPVAAQSWASPWMIRAIIVLAVFFNTVGLVGICLPAYRDWFLFFTPVNLALMAGVLVTLAQEPGRTLVFLLAAFAIGIGAEALGIRTGYPFGHYDYGQVLGAKVLGVPWLIGVYWGVLTYGTMQATRALERQPALWVGASALMLVGFDALMEPIAIRLGFWAWAGAGIHAWNGPGWFLTGLATGACYRLAGIKGGNPFALPLLAIQTLFFILLTWLLMPL